MPVSGSGPNSPNFLPKRALAPNMPLMNHFQASFLFLSLSLLSSARISTEAEGEQDAN
jgi:hypothetical protein